MASNPYPLLGVQNSSELSDNKLPQILETLSAKVAELQSQMESSGNRKRKRNEMVNRVEIDSLQFEDTNDGDGSQIDSSFSFHGQALSSSNSLMNNERRKSDMFPISSSSEGDDNLNQCRSNEQSENEEQSSNDSDGQGKQKQKKRRFFWTNDLHKLFITSIFDIAFMLTYMFEMILTFGDKIGLAHASHAKLLELMHSSGAIFVNSDSIREHLSHYRNNAKFTRKSFKEQLEIALLVHGERNIVKKNLNPLFHAYPLPAGNYPISQLDEVEMFDHRDHLIPPPIPILLHNPSKDDLDSIHQNRVGSIHYHPPTIRQFNVPHVLPGMYVSTTNNHHISDEGQDDHDAKNQTKNRNSHNMYQSKTTSQDLTRIQNEPAINMRKSKEVYRSRKSIVDSSDMNNNYMSNSSSNNPSSSVGINIPPEYHQAMEKQMELVSQVRLIDQDERNKLSPALEKNEQQQQQHSSSIGSSFPSPNDQSNAPRKGSFIELPGFSQFMTHNHMSPNFLYNRSRLDSSSRLSLPDNTFQQDETLNQQNKDEFFWLLEE